MKISPKHLQSITQMISTIRLAVNDDSDGCDSILQIGYLLGRTEGV